MPHWLQSPPPVGHATTGTGVLGGHKRFLLCHRLSAADACVRKRSLSSVAPPPRYTAYHMGLGFCQTQEDFQSPRSSFSLRQPCAPGAQGWELVGIPSCCPSQPGSAAPWCLSPFRWWKQSSALLLQASESKGLLPFAERPRGRVGLPKFPLASGYCFWMGAGLGV